MQAPFYAAIEAGGTKTWCAVWSGPTDGSVERIPTTEPEETLEAILRFLEPHRSQLAGIGVGSFGPLDLDPESASYGTITTTPKPGWSGWSWVRKLGEKLEVPIAVQTDVAASALGEGEGGAAQGLSDYLYLTVGTGIGGAVVANGSLVSGLVHPEIGHLRVPRAEADCFEGCCPYHRDCLEGMASGFALEQRWGDAAELPPEHPAWDLEVHYLAQGLANLVLTTSPKRIVIGGGVMEQSHLLPRLRRELGRLLAGYVVAEELEPGNLDSYVVAPGLGQQSALWGAWLLARQVALKSS